MKTFISDLSKVEFPIYDKVEGKSIRNSILKIIQKDYPHFNENDCLSLEELNFYRSKYLSNCLLEEVGQLDDLEQNVLDSLKTQSLISHKIEDAPAEELTFGQKLADKVASFGGSWTFIISFMSFLLIWILINIFVFLNKGFDPYPFILLNLILSCIAALQAPIIMMSQNRQEEKDRQRAKKDYMINLKSELEIRVLHEKIDHHIINQQREVIENQREQIEILQDILKKLNDKS